MMQCVKNLTAAALVSEKAQVRSLAWCSGLKDPVLPQLQRRLKPGLGFIPRPGNFHVLQVGPLKKRKRHNKNSSFIYVKLLRNACMYMCTVNVAHSQKKI